MANSAFDDAFALVVGAEGGYTADPRDAGNWSSGKLNTGELLGTNFGISAPVAVSLGLTPKTMTLDQAKTIYESQYWAKIQGDALPPPIALVLFDGAVNSGVSAAVRWAQGATGVTVDGALGPDTLAALQRASAKGLVAEIMARRIVYLAALPNWPTFALGWARRVQAIQGAALELVAPAPVPAPAVNLEPIKAALRAVLAEKAAA